MGRQYREAVNLAAIGKDSEAIFAFEALGDYKDAAEQVRQMSLALAEEYLAQGDTVHAAMAYGKAGEYDLSCELYWNKVTVGKTISVGRDGNIVAVKKDGTVAANSKVLSEWTDIVAVSSYFHNVAGLKSDGTVVVFNYNASDFDVSSWTDIIAISADSDNVIGLKSDGTVVTAKTEETVRMSNGEVLTFPYLNFSDWNNITSIAVDMSFTLGQRSDGRIMTKERGNVTVSLDLTDMADCIAVLPSQFTYGGCFYHCVVGIKRDGTVAVVSDIDEVDYSGILNWTGIRDISYYFSNHGFDDEDENIIFAAGLKQDKTVVTTGLDDDVAADVSTWTDIEAVSIYGNWSRSFYDGKLVSGGAAVASLKSDGTIVIAGGDDEVDLSKFTDIKVP